MADAANMLHFYFTPTSCSTASHIALEEAGADYQAHLVKLYKPEAVDEYRLLVNPKGKVPALVVDGNLLTENIAILAYVARAYPAARLAPEGASDHAKCLSFLAWLASDVHITRRLDRAPHRFSTDTSTHAGLRATGRAAFRSNLEALDALYAGKTWLMGDQFTIADAYALVFWGWAVEDGHPTDKLQHLAAFAGRMLERPAVIRVLTCERSTLLNPPQP